ncbi:MAG: hypothetical protein ABR903_07235, partial [Thermodesulfovibrionales bacterium]
QFCYGLSLFFLIQMILLSQRPFFIETGIRFFNDTPWINLPIVSVGSPSAHSDGLLRQTPTVSDNLYTGQNPEHTNTLT